MNQKLIQAKSLILEVIKERTQELPLAYGEEEGIEGFPKWSIYINDKKEIYSNTFVADKTKTLEENLSHLPLNILANLAENGVSGVELFEKINDSVSFQHIMCREAITDAKKWKSDNSLKFQKKKLK